MYGLPQAGALSNKALRKDLAPHGYYECAHTPGLWRHATRPIQFSLVVDDFGVKYVGKEHADHLVRTLRKTYEIAEDWAGEFYVGLKLDWHYGENGDDRYVEISMSGYVEKLRLRFSHEKPIRAQHSPYRPAPRKFGKNW